MAQARNTPSSQPPGNSQGSRLGGQGGPQDERTGLADGRPQEGLDTGSPVKGREHAGGSQGLAGAQGSGGGADRGMQQDPDQGRRDR
ncbi:MAG TPA: hypothetical protein VNO84_07360 [Burkholderiaceae bacterium]|nr:hypothetical protein [Burkholderiaceae bacterium]